MAKIFTYIVILYGTLLLLSLAGIPIGMEDLLGKFDLTGGTFWAAVIGITTLSFGIGVTLSRLIATSPDFYVSSSFAVGSLIPLTIGFSGVINYAHLLSDWVYYIVLVVFGVLGAGYLVACADWILNRGGN